MPPPGSRPVAAACAWVARLSANQPGLKAGPAAAADPAVMASAIACTTGASRNFATPCPGFPFRPAVKPTRRFMPYL